MVRDAGIRQKTAGDRVILVLCNYGNYTADSSGAVIPSPGRDIVDPLVRTRVWPLWSAH